MPTRDATWYADQATAERDAAIEHEAERDRYAQIVTSSGDLNGERLAADAHEESAHRAGLASSLYDGAASHLENRVASTVYLAQNGTDAGTLEVRQDDGNDSDRETLLTYQREGRVDVDVLRDAGWEVVERFDQRAVLAPRDPDRIRADVEDWRDDVYGEPVAEHLPPRPSLSERMDDLLNRIAPGTASRGNHNPTAYAPTAHQRHAHTIERA